MANKNMIDALKEIYSGQADCPDNANVTATEHYSHKGSNDYYYASELEAVICDTDVCNKDFFKDIVHQKNPFLAMTPKSSAQGAYLPIPLITGEDDE